MAFKPPHVPQPKPTRPLAAHVRQAVSTAAQASMAPAGRALAPHVQAAVSGAVQRSTMPRSTVQRQPAPGRVPAPHVQAAVGACQAMLQPRGPSAPAVVQRMEEYTGWETLKGEDLFHPPSPRASPIREDQKEILDYVRKEMVELSDKKKRKLLEKKTQSEKKIKIEKPQPKETVKGNIGEHAAERYFKKNGIKCLDANRVIQKNISGIDHIINHGGFCFSQSKVHIAAESLEALVKSYETNIDKRFLMALAFIQKVIKGNKFKALETANQLVGDNKVLALILKKIQTEDYESVSDLDTDMEAVQWAGDAILFPVPKDIYPKLSNKHQAFAVALAEDAGWFTSSLRKSFYMETKKILSEEKLEEKEDPTFEGEEEEEN